MPILPNLLFLIRVVHRVHVRRMNPNNQFADVDGDALSYAPDDDAQNGSIVYNLDEEVERRETEYRQLLQKLSETGMWPTLVASMNSGVRNNESGSRSRSLLSGRESLEPSTSAERDSYSADLVLSLDILESAIPKFIRIG